ncbi:MAG TPA: hypothetical protein VIL19_10940 [Casimicrobiaceae bacterium]
MATTLDGGAAPPVIRRGHGTAALGPSDSSDSGSDIQGGPGLVGDDGLLPRAGSTSDPDRGARATAGADIGDADLDSDTDREGTGERGAAGRDATQAVDTVLHDDEGRAVDADSLSDDPAAGAADDPQQNRAEAPAPPRRAGR